MRRYLRQQFPADSTAGKTLRRLAVLLLAGFGSVSDLIFIPVDAVRLWLAWQRGPYEIGAAAAGRHIVMLVVSTLRVDPRVRREARELADAGYSVTIIWPDANNHSGDALDWGEGIYFAPLPPEAGRFAYRFPGFLGMAMVRAARSYRPFAFHAHDLNTMLAALILGRETGAHVVADHHEWFSEHVTWSSRRNDYLPQGKLSKALNLWLEGLVQRHASRVITVGQAIADSMQAQHGGRPVTVIRNIPAVLETKMAMGSNLRHMLGVRDGQLLILYQGGIGPSRALEPVIAALEHAPDAVLAIRGPSIESYAQDYLAVAQKAGAADRLHLLPPVPQEQVVAATYGADCGLYTVADLCKSFSFALPNKVFEYLAAGLPILTADYPEVRKLVVENGAGLAFDPKSPLDIARVMREMADPTARKQLAGAAPRVIAANAPDAEWSKLRELYDELSRTAGV